MTGEEYQIMAMRTLNPDVKTMDQKVMNAALGMCGEAGEVAEMVKKEYFQGHKLDEAHLIKELGDVMWYIALMCDAFHITLNDVMETNVEKLKERYPNAFETARSINRESDDV